MPALRQQLANNGILVLAGDKTIGNARINSVSRVYRGAGQRQEHAGTARHMVQKPAAPHIGKQGNSHFGHSDTGSFRDYPMGAASHYAQTATHDNAMSPANQRLGIRVQGIVHPVFTGEEGLGIFTGPTGRGDGRRMQGLHIATGAERFLASALDKDGPDTVVIAPGVQLRLQQVDHVQGQGVQGGLNVQSDTPDLAARCGQFLKQYVRHQLFFHTGLRFSRKALTPSRWSSVLNRSTNFCRSLDRESPIALSRAA